MTDRRENAPDFTFDGVTWQCWIINDGQRYEWRSSCGRLAIWREGRVIRARRGGVVNENFFPTFKAAMRACQVGFGAAA